MNKDVYPAVFREDKDDKVPYFVYIPDFDGYTQGKNLSNAIEMAQDWIENDLVFRYEKGKDIPVPGSTEYELGDGEFISFVVVNPEACKKKLQNLSVKKNCTIPKWLAEKAEAQGINFSRVLQDALIERVGA